MKLLDILNEKKYSTDKHTVHRYIQEFYEEEFAKYRSTSTNVLEIGVLNGGSLKLWRDYFSRGRIVGIDIYKRVSMKTVQENVQGYDVELYEVDSFNSGKEFDQSRKDFINQFSTEGFDIIIDDGLHTEEAQYRSFYNFKELINPGGIYVIEDVRASSVAGLSKIEGIEFLHLNDGPGSKVDKQHIAVIRF